MEIFSGNCTALNSLYCVNNTTGANAEVQLATGLTIGDTYYVRVYSYDDITGQGDFELCITSPIPANDECAGAKQLVPAGELVCSNPTFGTTIGATQSSEPACNGTADDDVWYKFNAVANKHLITLTSAATNGIDGAVVGLYSGSCSSLNNLYCNRDYGSGTVQINAPYLTIGETYYVRVHSYDANFGNGDFSICVSTYNEVCEGAQTLIVNPDNNCTNVISGSTYYSGNQNQIPGCSGYPDDNLWYKFVATATTHRIKVTPSATNGIRYPVLETFDGYCGNLTSTSCTYNNNPPDAPVEKSLTNLIIGNTYYVRVYSYSNGFNNGSFEICVSTPPQPPANDNCSGAVTLTVTASSTCTNPVSGTTINATQSMPACNQTITTYSDDDVWYKFTAVGNTTHFDITPVGPNALFDLVMQMFQTNNCSAIGSIGSSCFDNLPGTGAASFRTYTTPGAVYYFRIYSAANGTGQGDFTICAYYDGPPNDDCGGAINVPVNNDNSCTLTTAGTTLYATSSNAPPGCTSILYAEPDDDVWYKFTATAASQIITVTPTALGGIDNAVLRFYYYDCSNLNGLTCINNTTGADAETYTAENLTIGTTYYFSVHSYLWSYGYDGQGAFTVCIKNTILNDECTGAFTIPVNDDASCTNTYHGTTVGSSSSNPPVGCASGSYDVWYKFVANNNAYHIAITPDATGGIINPVSNLYSGNCNSLVSIACGSHPSTFENLTPGNTYYLRITTVNGNVNSTGAFNICVKSITLPNDICTGAVNVPISNAVNCVTNVTGTTVGATISQSTGIKDVWYKFTATETAHKINVSPTADSLKNVAFEVYSGTCGNLTSLAYVDHNSDPSTLDTTKPETQSFENLTIGNTYYIRVFNTYLIRNGIYVNTTGSFNICVSLSGNDVCSFARNIIVNAGTECNEITIDSTNNSTYPLNLNAVNDCTNYNQAVNDSWFKFIALDTAQLITILPISGNAAFAQLLSGNCGALTSMICMPAGNIRQPIGGLTIGQTYYLRVYTQGASAGGKFSICISKTAFNDECINATDITVNSNPGCTVVNNGSTRGATRSSAGSCSNFYNLVGNDVWYKFTATSAQQRVTVTGTTPDLQIYFTVYSGTCNSLSQIVCVNDYNPIGGSTDEEATALDNLVPGNTYFIRVYNQIGLYTTGDFTICVSNVDPLNDLCSNAIAVPVNSGDNCTQTITGNNKNSTRSYDAPYLNYNYNSCPEYANADLFYKFIATSASLKITITPTATGGIDDVMFEVYSGTCGSLSFIGNADATSYNREEVLRLDDLTSGNTYIIRVSNANGAISGRGSFTICINEPPLNDECSGAVTLAVNTNANCTLQTTGTTVAATPANGLEDVWYKFVATATEHKITVTSITMPNPVFSLYKGGCNNLIQIREEINYDAGGTTVEFQSYDSLVIGNTYYIRVRSIPPDFPPCRKYGNFYITGTFSICVSAPSQPNDLIDNAINVPVNSGSTCTNSVTADNTGSTYSFNRNDCYNRTNSYLPSGQFYLSDLWYKFTAIATSHIVTLTPAATGGMRNPAFAVYERPTVNNGDNLLQRGCVNFTDNDNDAESQSINGLVPGKEYFIRVMSDIHTLFQGEFNLCITTPVLPVYTEKIITYAGGGSGEGVSAENSKLYRPTDVAVDNHGNVYIADSARVKRINLSDGVVTVIAGTGVAGSSGDNGAAINAKIASKLKIAIDNSGNIFLADYEGITNTDNGLVSDFGRVRKIAAGTGIITTIISMPIDIVGYTPLSSQPIYLSRSITGLTTDATGNIYITVNRTEPVGSGSYPGSKWFNIYKQTPAGIFTELRNDSHYAYGLTIDAANNLYFATAQGLSPCYTTNGGGYGACFNGTPAPYDTRYIRKLLPDGSSQIIAGLQQGAAIIGQGPFGYTGDGGLAFNAQLKPADVKSDAAGNLYVADGNGYWNGAEYGNYAIRKINTAGIINTIAGTGISSYSGDEGTAQQAAIHTPVSLALDSAGNVYIADVFDNSGAATNRIRKILAACNSGIAMANKGNTFYITAPLTIYKDCDTIARISPIAPLPFNKDVTGKVWIEPSVPLYNGVSYVARHYEITPLTNPATSSARITLYFKQPEFTAYNVAVGTGLKLPTGPADAAGISNLLVIKRDGISANGTGLQETYSGAVVTIDPANNDIVWNIAENRWEVSFDVSSFSGFFVRTALPVSSNTDYYRSITSGDWNSTSTWESSSDSITFIPATSTPTSTDKRVSIMAGHTVTVISPVTIDKTFVEPGGTFVVTGTTLTVINNGLTFRSSADGTGRLGASTGSISGKVNVERYIGAPSAKRAWRLLTAPIAGGASDISIFNSWQLGGTIGTEGIGKGTLITGPGANGSNGLDVVSGYSLKEFDGTNLVGVDNTHNALLSVNASSAANKPYFIFVRGDRSSISLPGSSNTVLGATGSLQTGSQIFATNAIGNGFANIGNPYASPVDFDLLRQANTSSNIKPNFYFWDPNLNTVGGYVTVSYDGSGSSYTIAPSGADRTRYIQSGQAIFVQTNMAGSGTAAIEFHEDQKVGNNINNVFRAGSQMEKMEIKLNIMNASGSGEMLVDGIVAKYHNSFFTNVGDEDAQKIMNIDENLSFERDGILLSIEGRPLVDDNDTLFLKMSNLKLNRTYRFDMVPDQFNAPLLTAYLIDDLLNTSTPISLSNSTQVTFDVTAAPASYAPNRFKIVFRNSIPLPITSLSITAIQKDMGVQVNWENKAEINIDHYQLERSTNGRAFNEITTIKAKENKDKSVAYNWYDPNPVIGNNFYRLKMVENNNKTTYSQIIKIVFTGKNVLQVFPNPANNTITVSGLENNGIIKIIEANGKVVKQIKVTSNSMLIDISTLAKGVYVLQYNDGGKVQQVKIMKE